MKTWMLEGCVDSVRSAACAEQGGATRLELCANLVIGGTTVRPSVLHQVLERVHIPVRVLIRPRFGDFLYHEDEILEMEEDIRTLTGLGAEGIVIGALTPDGRLNETVLKRLIDAASGRPVTLHRAFDMSRDPFEALETAIRLGFDTILTSGQKDDCLEGLALIRALDAQAAGRIRIMCGSGVSASVIRTFLKETGITAYHMSGKRTEKSGMIYRNPSVHMGLKEISEYESFTADAGRFQEAAETLLSFLDDSSTNGLNY